MTKPTISIDADVISLTVAVCAIIISGASFYATYLQAQSSERQVKAMTMPLLQFEHGNYDEVSNKKAITFALKNAGVGPASLKAVKLLYKGRSYDSVIDFLVACCGDQWRPYHERLGELSREGAHLPEGSFGTKPLNGAIIPGQSEYLFFGLGFAPVSEALWNKVDDERWNLTLSVCYCSMLDECYAGRGDEVKEVGSCPVREN